MIQQSYYLHGRQVAPWVWGLEFRQEKTERRSQRVRHGNWLNYGVYQHRTEYLVEDWCLDVFYIAKPEENPLCLVPDFKIPNPPQWPTGSGLGRSTTLSCHSHASLFVVYRIMMASYQ